MCGHDSRRLVQVSLKTHSVFTIHLIAYPLPYLSQEKTFFSPDHSLFSKNSPMICVPRLREILQYCAEIDHVTSCNILVRSQCSQVMSGVGSQLEWISQPQLCSRVPKKVAILPHPPHPACFTQILPVGNSLCPLPDTT